MSSSGTRLVKVIVLGDSSVGKTSLINKYVNQEYSQLYKPTVGADFRSKEVVIDNRVIRLQIWDTAGQEQYRCLGPSFYRGADCCLLAYDITSSESFRSLDVWRKMMLEYANPVNAESFPFVVVGNKVDKETDRQVLLSTAQEWLHNKNEMPIIECSAKDYLNVQEAFQALIKLSLNQTQAVSLFSFSMNRIPESSLPRKRKCCY